ncbi:hypothetical protein [Haloactinomyces albus]|uniref:Uncharacterized protein n=1 Tax=Haloactinomyces albus TaxID=1352928 RepID=A0AAE3ZHN9_9ACTN|nr:hypothetical protein [Haloactinomyces albus]MDR7303860.1 hypothetical protein [Haloactinomyces albus]
MSKRSLWQRYQRFRRLWRATLTGAELGYTGPAALAEFNPPANRHWIRTRLVNAVDQEDRRKAAHGYLMQTLRLAEQQAAETEDTALQEEVDRARLWVAECDLVAVSVLEQAQRAGGHAVPEGRVDDPARFQRQSQPESALEPEPVDLDEFKGDRRQP